MQIYILDLLFVFALLNNLLKISFSDASKIIYFETILIHLESCFWVEKTFNQESNPRWNGYKGRSYMIGFFILTKHGTCCIADLTVYFNDLVWNSNFFRLQPWQFWFGLEWGNRITRWLLVKKSNRLMIRWSVLNSSGSNSNFEF